MIRSTNRHAGSATTRLGTVLVAAALVAMAAPAIANASPPESLTKEVLATGFTGATGSAIGPDEALYVPAGRLGTVTRIDPETGATTTVASALPVPASVKVPTGGPMDVAFIGHTMYVLVTLVGPEVGGSSINGIYRVDGGKGVPIVDLGAYSAAHTDVLSGFAFGVKAGLQYAMQPFGDGFLVTDGHHNRVLRVPLVGTPSDLKDFNADVVPTGLSVSHNTVFIAEAGPIPHEPATGKVVSFNVNDQVVKDVASGARLAVDVKFGPEGDLYVLSQGEFPNLGTPATPAVNNTGKLLRLNKDGTFTVIMEQLDQPTSLEFIGETAFVTTLGGTVYRIKHVSRGGHGEGEH
jgi:hypothetical protein